MLLVVAMKDSITDVEGVRVGHWTDKEAATGCTVVLCEGGAVAGVEVRGAAPGTRETDLLRPGTLVSEVHAILLTGGSAFGLDAAGGVMRYLEERGIGFPTSAGPVPIVPAAVLYDLGVGNPKVRPNAEAGYAACLSASDAPVTEGSVGAGTGATVGKAKGIAHATKAGVGTASQRWGKWVVGALVAVNALGEVVDPDTGRIVAGVRNESGGFIPTLDVLKSVAEAPLVSPTNTTLGVVATNATLTKAEANRLAQMAHSGLARTIRPAYTMGDGDTVFALALGQEEAPTQGALGLSLLGAMAAEVVAQAVLRAVRQAESLAGLPAVRDLEGKR